MQSLATALSTIRKAPTSYFIYSSLSFFGRHRGGELPGMWFVTGLADVGRDVAAVRQTLYRMTADGELKTRSVGRTKLYRATSFASAEIDAGLAKLFQPAEHNWDGQWTMVYVNLHGSTQRAARERVVALLAVRGFALLGNDVYFHPRDVQRDLVDALSPAARPHVLIVRGALANPAATGTVIRRWNVPHLARRYRQTIAHLETLEQHCASDLSNRDAFVYRFAVVFDYLGVAWDDPGLPVEVLPSDWPGENARTLAARLYERLVEQATAYADELLEQTLPTPLVSR